jgi:hypothetical protein
MARRHILYNPFVGGGDPSWTVDWNTKNTKHNYTYETLAPGSDLSTLPWYSEIYIRGHGGDGDHEIADGNHNVLKYDAVADLLIADGLKRTWSGVIKCLNCSSGVPTLGRQSFAAKFAQYMRGKGYLLISFVGYLGPVDGYPLKNDPNAHYDHKYTTIFGHEVKNKWARAFF